MIGSFLSLQEPDNKRVLQPEIKKSLEKVANEFFSMMNQTANYEDKQTIWGSVLLIKARELVHFLTGETKELDFVSPDFGVNRVDSHEIRQKILSISYVDWKK